LFADYHITDPVTGEKSDLQLGYNYREFSPTYHINLGKVLDKRDAVAAKMSALYSRGEVRDYIDIYNTITEGHYSPTEILALGDQQEAEPFDREMLEERFRLISKPPPEKWTIYEPNPNTRNQIIHYFQQWADSLKQKHTLKQNSTSPTQTSAPLSSGPITVSPMGVTVNMDHIDLGGHIAKQQIAQHAADIAQYGIENILLANFRPYDNLLSQPTPPLPQNNEPKLKSDHQK